MVFPNHDDIILCLNKHKIQTRPNAGLGLWVMFLLPLAVIISATAHPIVTTHMYKVSSLFCVGLICSSVIFINQSSKNKRLGAVDVWLLLACVTLAVLFQICLHKGIFFSFLSAVVSTFVYYKLYLLILENLPKCFTLGEAATCAQSYILLVYFTGLNIAHNIVITPTSMMQMSTLIIQFALTGVSLIFVVSNLLRLRESFKFYVVTLIVVLFFAILPLNVLLKTDPLLWLLTIVWKDIHGKKIILYWLALSILAGLVTNWRIKSAERASTVVRKVFHFLVVAVFIPGLLYDCSLLYLATGLALAVILMIEMMRILNTPPFAESLQNGFSIFSDGKDTGMVAFTPIYLLTACSLPIWIHPAPCDVTNSAVFNFLLLLSGVLTIGVGDTAASIVGSKFGKHHWKDSTKTLEGTLACIASQLLVIFSFVYLDVIRISMVECAKTVSAVIFTALVEAKTDQVDNLVLPFVMYIMLII